MSKCIPVYLPPVSHLRIVLLPERESSREGGTGKRESGNPTAQNCWKILLMSEIDLSLGLFNKARKERNDKKTKGEGIRNKR